MIDLCQDIGDDEIARLPGVQAGALSIALLRRAPDAPTTPHIVAFAFTTLLRRSATECPVLVCIDDLQWLDAQTADVLAFAARRLPEGGVGVLATLRTDPDVGAPAVVADLAAALPLTRTTVAPLGADRLAGMLRTELGRDVPSRAPARRGAAARPGTRCSPSRSPARCVAGPDEGGLEDAPLPVPESLDRTGRPARRRRCPSATRVAPGHRGGAAPADTCADCTPSAAPSSLDAAGRAGLITVRGHEVDLQPPDVRRGRVSPARPERAHATCTPGSPRSPTARRSAPGTCAHGCVDADETVAAALDVARDRAISRGAVAAALDAARLARPARRRPGSGALRPAAPRARHVAVPGRRRRGGAGRGDPGGRGGRPASRPRAGALYVLGRLVNDSFDPFEAAPISSLQALELAGDDPSSPRTSTPGWPSATRTTGRPRSSTGVPPSRWSTRCRTPDPTRAAKALAAVAGAHFYAGGGLDIAACRRAIELQEGDLSLIVSDRAIAVLFYLQFWGDDFAGARETMDAAYQLRLDEGDEGHAATWSRPGPTRGAGRALGASPKS